MKSVIGGKYHRLQSSPTTTVAITLATIVAMFGVTLAAAVAMEVTTTLSQFVMIAAGWLFAVTAIPAIASNLNEQVTEQATSRTAGTDTLSYHSATTNTAVRPGD